MYSVLYVDDDESLLDIASLFLKQNGEFAINTATSARSGLEKLREHPYDAIISDYQMPEIDGIAFLKEVRERFGTIPFLLFTGKGREEIIIEALNHGADSYIQKGGDPRLQFAELTHKLRNAIQRRKSEDALRLNEERLRMSQAIGQLGSWELFPETGTIWASKEAFRIFGLARPHDGLVPIGIVEAQISERERVHDALVRFIKGDPTYDIEYTIIPADGSPQKILKSIAHLTRDSSGRPVRVMGVISDVTARRQAGQALRESEEKFRYLVEYGVEGNLITNLQGTILFANAMAARLVEADTTAALVGRNVMEFIAPASREAVIRDFMLVATGKDGYPAQYPIISMRGKNLVVESVGKVITYEGKPADLLSLRDITEQKKAEEKLRKSEIWFRSIIQNANDFVMIIGRGGMITYSSPGGGLGYPENILTGKDPLSLVHPDDRDRVMLFLDRAYSREQSRLPFEFRIQKADSTYLQVESVPSNLLEVPEINGIVLMTRDASERRRTQETISALLNAPPDLSVLIDPEGKICAVNDALCHRFSRVADNLFGVSLYSLFMPDVARRRKIKIDEAIEKKKPVHFIDERQGAFFENFNYPVIDSGGAVIYVAIYIRDITEQRKVEEELRAAYEQISASNEELQSQYRELSIGEQRIRESRELYSSLFESANDAIFIAEDGVYIRCNRKAWEIFGCAAEKQLIGHSPAEFSPLRQPDGRDSREAIRQNIAAVLAGTPLTMEWEYFRADGTPFMAEVSLNRVVISGKILIQAIIRDISERKITENNLRRLNHKLNLLTGITRHDILNKMTAIQGYIYLIKECCPDQGTHGFLVKLEQAVSEIKSYIDLSQIYTDIGSSDPRWQDIEEIVRRVNVPAHITVATDLKNAEAYADPMLVKIFYNLYDNSVRHGKGVTSISVSAQENADHLSVFWEDNGIGVPNDEKKKIFETGYGRNTGLGLSLSREILSITGLSIRENGVPGKGARFEIVVPKGKYRFSKIAD